MFHRYVLVILLFPLPQVGRGVLHSASLRWSRIGCNYAIYTCGQIMWTRYNFYCDISICICVYWVEADAVRRQVWRVWECLCGGGIDAGCYCPHFLQCDHLCQCTHGHHTAQNSSCSWANAATRRVSPDAMRVKTFRDIHFPNILLNIHLFRTYRILFIECPDDCGVAIAGLLLLLLLMWCVDRC